MCAQKPEACKIDNFYFVENRTKSVLKDMAVYALPHIAGAVVFKWFSRFFF